MSPLWSKLSSTVDRRPAGLDRADRLWRDRAQVGDRDQRPTLTTTPCFQTLAAGAFRHPDHRFEWSRDQFEAWAARIGETLWLHGRLQRDRRRRRRSRRTYPDGGVQPMRDRNNIEASSDLTIPDFALVVLIGSTGSGKSTFAAKHFLPTEVISSDRCRALVSDDRDQSGRLRRRFRPRARDRRQAAETPQVDGHRRHKCARRRPQGLGRTGAANGTPCRSPSSSTPASRSASLATALRPDRDFGAGVPKRMAMEIRKGMGGPSARGLPTSLEADQRKQHRGRTGHAPAVVD